jgi:hypothetical protein
MNKIVLAILQTIRVTLENLTFAGSIAILLDGEMTLLKSFLTALFFILTVIVRIAILRKEERIEGGE